MHLVFCGHMELVVPCIRIHEAEQCMAHRRVEQPVDLWEREIVFWTSLVQVREVDAHPPGPSLLSHQNYIGQSLGVLVIPDKTYG